MFQLYNLFFVISYNQLVKNACILQIWIIVVLPVSIGHSCDDRQDVKYVNRCPETIDEWNAAAEKKNCQYVHDDCPVTVTEYKLVYHCVKVRNQPIFVELCSKVWKSQGMIRSQHV